MFENNSVINDNNKLYGKVSYKIYDKTGNIIDSGTANNNIVLGIRKPIIKLLSGIRLEDKTTLPFVKYIKLGKSDSAVSPENTQVVDPIVNSEAYIVTDPVEGGTDQYPNVTFSFVYPEDSPDIDDQEIKEMGLYTSSNTMIARVVVGSWKKISGLFFEIYWTIGYKNTETD